MAQKLTDRTIFSGTVDKDNDLIHLVDVSDTSQDPAGSSFKTTPKKFINSYISSDSETEGQTLYYDSTTGKFLNTSILHVDDGNGFVGIGITSALTAKLHVKSASGEAFRVDGSSLSGIGLVYNDGRFQLGRSTSYIRQIDNGANDNLQIYGDYVNITATNDHFVNVTDIYGITTATMWIMPTAGLEIGNNTGASTSAILDVKSTTKGVMFPRMTAAQASAVTPVEALMLFVTDTNGTFTSIGYWAYENGAWKKL